MGKLYLGQQADPRNPGEVIGTIDVDHGRHGMIFGPTGVGKTNRILTNNLIGDGLTDQSVIVIDPEGEAFLTTAEYRAKKLGHRVAIIDPFGRAAELVYANREHYAYLIEEGLVDSAGFNPMGPPLDPESDDLYDNAAALAEDRIELNDRDHHFAPSGQGLDAGLIMLVKDLKRDKASLSEVRRLLTEPDVLNKDGEPVSGLAKTAADIIKRNARINGEGIPAVANSYDIMASLIGRFRTPTRETQSVVSTVDTQTRWMLSRKIRMDMARPGFDFKTLKLRPTTLFIIIPSIRLRTYRRWVRLLIGSALRALYTPGGLRVTFFLDEMPTALGNLPMLGDAFATARKFNIQLVGIAQDYVQLKHLFEEQAETFLANSSFIQFFGANDMTTAKWVSERSGSVKEDMASSGTSQLKDAFRKQVTVSEQASQAYQPYLRPEHVIGMPTGTGVVFLSQREEVFHFKAPFYDDDPALAGRHGYNPFRVRPTEKVRSRGRWS